MFQGFGMNECIPWPSPPRSPCWRSPGRSWRGWTRPTHMSVLAAGGEWKNSLSTMHVVKIYTPTCCYWTPQRLPVHLRSKNKVRRWPWSFRCQAKWIRVAQQEKNITWCFSLTIWLTTVAEVRDGVVCGTKLEHCLHFDKILALLFIAWQLTVWTIKKKISTYSFGNGILIIFIGKINSSTKIK